MFETIEQRFSLWKRLLLMLISATAHILVILALILLPLLFFDLLPEIELITWLAPPPPPPASPPPPPPPGEKSRAPQEVTIRTKGLIAPERLPEKIPSAPDEPFLGVPSLQGDQIAGITSAIQGPGNPGAGGIGPPPAIAQPLPPPPKPPARREPVRQGGVVMASKLVQKVEPVYPHLAKLARVQGAVILQVTVDEEGNVSDIRVLRGHPLLDDAALQAVWQWKYSPTFLNGEPVPVIATVTVIFTLR